MNALHALVIAFVCLAPRLVCTVGAASEQPALHASAQRKEESRCFAVLVGCTRYDHLPEKHHLRGPANDVVLMEELLRDRFGVPQERISVLSEAESANGRPTRENIERELRRLSEKVRSGDQAVIFMAGHGSQQPDDDPRNPKDPEPDGFDETFLPADVRGWDQTQQEVSGAIVDDDLRTWLGRIRDRGAFVWITLDSCHSGTAIRNDAEVIRRISPGDLGITDQDLAEARKRAGASRETVRGIDSGGKYGLAAGRGGIVALYAARAAEPTIEKNLPPGSPIARPYGLLTYTTAHLLNRRGEPITYRELAQAIQQRYLQWGRAFPTPLLEGTEIDRQVLGLRSWPGRSSIRLSRNAEGLRIDAGFLHGMTNGSVFAVHPPAGETRSNRLLGYVRIEQAEPFSSVVKPTAFADVPAKPVETFPEHARCTMAFQHFGDARVKVAIDAAHVPNSPGAATTWRKASKRTVKELAQQDGAFVTLVDEIADAQWVLGASDKHVSLVPVSDVARKPGRDGGRGFYGPAPTDAGWSDWLAKSVRRIARVENLLSLASPVQGDVYANSKLDLKIHILQFPDRNSRDGEVVTWKDGRKLNTGDLIGFRVRNQSRFPVDATFLFVDSDYEITAFFPEFPGAGANRIPTGKELLSPRAEVTRSDGTEHMVVIAVKAGKTPLDFTCLAQPSLDDARALRGAHTALGSPLGRLLQSSLFGEGGRRGLRRVATANYDIRLISWKVGDK